MHFLLCMWFESVYRHLILGTNAESGEKIHQVPSVRRCLLASHNVSTDHPSVLVLAVTV